MKLTNSRFTFAFIFVKLMLHLSGFYQSKKQQELEQRPRELQREIQQISTLLFAGKKDRRFAFNDG